MITAQTALLETVSLASIDRSLPADGKTYAACKTEQDQWFYFVRDAVDAWDVSIQLPYRRFLGKVKLSDRGWQIISIAREPYDGQVFYPSYQEAACCLLRLSLDPMVDNRTSGRAMTMATGIVSIGLFCLSLLPLSAFATTPPPQQNTDAPSLYRGSGR
jgi:hypothetical protein